VMLLGESRPANPASYSHSGHNGKCDCPTDHRFSPFPLIYSFSEKDL